MFDISNTIAYDGLMVYGTPDRTPFHGRNIWYHVQPSGARGHWISAEGDALRQILTRLRDHGVPAAQIRVISPFRQVVAEAMRAHREVYPDNEINSNDRRKWVGTVHTMQGKEADVVILVLGGNPEQAHARGRLLPKPRTCLTSPSPAPGATICDRRPQDVGHCEVFQRTCRTSRSVAATEPAWILTEDSPTVQERHR